MSASASPGKRSGLALHWQILIGLALGATAGVLADFLTADRPEGAALLRAVVENVAYPIGQIFLRLIFMVVVPLVFCALTLGVTAIGDVRQLGRIGLLTLALTLLLSSISVVIAIVLVNTVRPGEHTTADQRAALQAQYETDASRVVQQARKAKPLRDALLDIIPRNPLQEMVGALDGSSPGGGMLAVMFFALAFGVALATLHERGAPVVRLLESVYDVVMVIISFAMRLAPVGVAALVFSLTAQLGLGVFQALLGYMLTVVLGLALHMLVVYSLVLLAAGYRPWRFFGRAAEALLTAFSTSSSNATLPTALRVAEQRVGVRPRVGRFVLTIGSTANQNGTALYEGITVLFLAQLFGLELSFAQQVTVALMSILAGVGTAGVPGGSLGPIVLLLASVGVPPDSIAIILGIDRLLDMCRTVVNVAGDLTIAVCADRWGVPGSGEAPAHVAREAAT
jgi:DAACS family dicarboxylate/amino acid:cation (Na+ or H+) symporter